MRDEERTPLRVVLRNFLNHIENLESQISPDKSYDIEFQSLKVFSENVKGLKEFSSLEGEKEINRKKNRYKDILPFDVSRVVLQEYNGIPGSDYINANYIKGASGSPAYIASQGPLPCTVNDFWRMVVQCEVHVIVMACNQEEAGKAKCEKYWVDEGEERHFGRISVRLLKSSTVCPDFSVRTMRLKYSNTTSMVAEERTVCQVHYVAWPDHGVPSVVHPLLDMVRLVRDTQASETLPVLVHCSAGCGRTGTICAIDYVFGLLRTGKLTSDFSLSALIRDMRRQRIAMVQTKEQYVLVHQAVRELFREQLSVIDSHPYENVDPDGLLIIKTDQDSIYDAIDYQNAEEKGDFKMEKEAKTPLLPTGKKNVTLYSSKQEKEVENLTEQLRSVQARPKTKMPANISLASRSLAGHNSHTAKSSQKQGLTVKKELNTNYNDKPIPSKGILRVPLLMGNTAGNSQSPGIPIGMVPVKRSKSLKIMPAHREKGLGPRLTVPPDPQTARPRETQSQQQTIFTQATTSQATNRTSSLELASYPEIAGTSINTQGAVHPTKDETSSVTKKYEALKICGKKPLMRSYTTLDMRHKFMMPSPDGKTFKLQPVDPRLGLAGAIGQTERVNLSDGHFGEPSSAINTWHQANTRSTYTTRNVQPSLRLPARSYLLREKPAIASNISRNIISSQNSHFPATQTEYHSTASAVSHHKLMAKYHLAPPPTESHQIRDHQVINHHRILLPKNIPPSGQNKYKDQPKIPWQHPADYKEGESKHYDVPPIPVEYLDKYLGLTSDLTLQKHVFDQQRLPPPPAIQMPLSGPALGKSTGLYPPLPPRNQLALAPMTPRYLHLENCSFETAPGVDIDQVAASIPSRDESKSNLMKVALEAFQVKKSKQQSRADALPKGTSHGFSAGKKKQQQYL